MSTLDIKLRFKALGNIVKPFKDINKQTQKLQNNFNQTKSKLSSLKAGLKNTQSLARLNASLNQNGQALTAMREQAKKLAQQIKTSKNPSAKLRNEFNKARTSVTQLEQAHRQYQVRLKSLRDKLKNAGLSTRNLSAQESRLKNNISQTNAALTKQNQLLARTRIQQKKLAQVAAKRSQTNKTLTNSGMAGLTAATAGGSGLFVLKGMLSPAISFEENMSKVLAKTGLDKNSKDFAQLQNKARQLGASTQFSATAAAQGMDYLAMAGLKPQQIIAAMPGLLDLAKVGDIELGDTADIASNILSAFKLEAKEMTRVADVMAATITSTNVDVRMLGDTMKYVAPAAQSVGASLEEASAMAGILGNIGIQGEAAGTAMRNMYNRLSKPPAEAKKALKALNIQTQDAKGNLLPLPKILAAVAEATKDMGSAKKLGYFADIAGLRAGGAMKELVDMAEKGQIQKLASALEKSNGSARKMAKQMGDNIAGDIKEMNSAWQEFNITLAKSNASPLRELIKMLTGVIRSAQAFAKANPKITSTIVKVVAILSVFLVLLGTLTMAMTSIAMPIMTAKFAMTSFGISTNLALLPILKLTAAITLLAVAGYAIYTNWSGITQFFNIVFSDLKNTFAGIQSLFTLDFNLDLSNIYTTFASALNGLKNLIFEYNPLTVLFRIIHIALEQLGFKVPFWFGELGKNMLNGLIAGLTYLPRKLADAVTNLANATKTWFKQALGINSPSKVFKGFGHNIAQGIGLGISTNQMAAIAPIKALGNKLPSVFDAQIKPLAPSDNNLQSQATQSSKSSVQMGDIHIHINSGNANAQDIAQQVRIELEKLMHNQQMRSSSALYDNP